MQTWGSWNTLTDNVTTTFNADNLYSWDIQVKVEDSIGSTTYNLSIGVGIPIFFIDRIKQSIGINCFPTDNNSFEINGTGIIDLIHPVGSIYMSVDNTSPATLFGGTWQQIEDRVPLGAGQTFTAGATGGNANGIGSLFGIAGANYGGLSGGQGQGNYNGRVAVVDGSLQITQSSMAYFNNVSGMDFMPPYLVLYIWKRIS